MNQEVRALATARRVGYRFSAMQALDWIAIRDLQVSCVIGVYAEERTREQPVMVTARLGFQAGAAAKRERLEETLDYVAVCGQIGFLLRSCRFGLIETAAEALASYLLAPPASGERRQPIERVVLEIHKPHALPEPATAQVTIERSASPGVLAVEEKTFGTVDVLYETTDAGIYRLNIAPGREIPLHVHHKMDEHELVLTRGVECQGRATSPGTVFHWPKGAAHYYRNPTSAHQTILCVDVPRFMPDDEIEVRGTPAEVVVEQAWAPRATDGRLLDSR
jgi:dihydroneopterin aldolase